jgi:hypothetical protein
MARSHGAPRNPRCQGLVERYNFTLKRALMKRMMEAGYHIGLGTFEWYKHFLLTVRAENRNHIKLYGAVTPFLLLRGMPPDFPSAVAMEPAAVSNLHSYCAQRQVAVAYKNKGFVLPFPATDSYDIASGKFGIGDVVRVKWGGTAKHKDPNAIAMWSARGVVIKIHSKDRYCRVRWISRGLSAERPGSVSRRWYHETRLALDPNRVQGHAMLTK